MKKNNKWKSVVDDCSKNGKWHTLQNRLLNKGKMWVEGDNFEEHKAKKPTLKGNIEDTKK